MHRDETPDEPEDEFEERMWSLCREEKKVDVFQPAFIWGPRKIGLRYSYRRPPWATPSNSEGRSEGQRQGQFEGELPQAHKGEEGGAGNQQPFSEFSDARHELVSKAKQIGHNVNRVMDAAMHTKAHPFTGFLGEAPSRSRFLGGTKFLAP